MFERLPTARRAFSVAALVAFYLLHQDFWLWDDARLVAGLPIGLAYHVAYCLGASLIMLVLIRGLSNRREDGA